MINLKESLPLGQGSVKKIYEMPGDSEKIIKIIHPHLVSADGSFKNQGFFKKKGAQGIYRQFRREIIQYLQLCKSSYGTNRFIFPMEVPYGLVETDLGLGLVTEKITAPDGKGWTLSQLARGSGLEAKHYNALSNFFDECVRLHLVFGEVNIAGIMYTEKRQGKPEFVLVDGIGEKLFFPLRALSPWINSKYIRKVQRRILQQVETMVDSRQP